MDENTFEKNSCEIFIEIKYFHWWKYVRKSQLCNAVNFISASMCLNCVFKGYPISQLLWQNPVTKGWPWAVCKCDALPSWTCMSPLIKVSALRLKQNGCYFADYILKWIFMNENIWISIKISLKVVPKWPTNNIPALVQIMAWGQPGD